MAAVSQKSQPSPLSGSVRRGRRTKKLVRALHPGEIALIDHQDLDRVSAEDLISAEVAGVLNCHPSRSEEYPNMGPLLLIEAGIRLIDLPDDALFDLCRDGDRLELRGGEVWRGGEMLVAGEEQLPAIVIAANAQRRREIGDRLHAITAR